jgi:glycosyltransferase involved in cell wall biosynthesis
MINESPSISVIMPVFNEEKYVNEAIESILDQTYQDFEFIIINDGSRDNSLRIIKSYNDKRISIINNEENIGISESLNKGFILARGTYIARMDANDIAHRSRFELQIDYLKNNDVGLIGTQYIIIDEQSNILRDGIVRYFEPDQTISYLSFYNICHASVMLEKKLLLDLEYIYAPVLAEDFDLYQRLSLKTNFFILPNKLMQIRKLAHGLSGNWDIVEQDIDKMRICRLGKIDIQANAEQSSMHSKLVNGHYNELIKFPPKILMDWIETIIKANNKIKFFPNPFFNENLFSRLSRYIELKNKINLFDVYKYNKISELIGKKQTLKDLILIYIS